MNKTSQNNLSKGPVNGLVNGVAVDYLNIDDRAIHYGDGLFETILCRAGKLYYWPQHFARLQRSAQHLKIPCPSQKLLLQEIAILLAQNSEQAETACAIKIILSRGAGERGYALPKKVSASRLLSLSALASDYSSLLSEKLLSGQLFVCQQQVSINQNLAGIKHLNRLENVLARNEWQGDYIDGLMLNANQHVIEGTMSNLFAIRNKQLFTPDLALSGVNGIMRGVIMQLAGDNKMDVIIQDLDLSMLSEMDEIFISNSLIGMKSVTELAEVAYNKPQLSQIIFDALLNSMEDYAQDV